MQSSLKYVGCLLVLLQCASTLYEDQVGSYDWHQEYVGGVSYVSVDQSAKSNRGIVVASEKGVLAVLSPGDGSIRWRRVYEPTTYGNIDAVLRNKYGSVVTVSGNGQLLRSWEISSGVLKYEASTSLPIGERAESDLTSLAQSWRPAGVSAALAGKNKGVIVVTSGSKVAGFAARTGESKWTNTMSTDGVVCSVQGEQSEVEVWSVLPGQHLLMTLLNVSKGTIERTLELPAPWASINATSCIRTASALVCVDMVAMDIHWVLLPSQTTFHSSSLLQLLPSLATHSSLSLTESSRQNCIWLATGDHTHLLLDFSNDVVALEMTLSDGFPFVGVLDDSGSWDGHAIDARVEGGDNQENGKKMVVLRYHDNGSERRGELEISEPRGRPVTASAQFFTRSDQTVTFRVAVVMEDDSILLFSGGSGQGWVREDGLGAVGDVEFLDLPADQSAMVESFLDKSSSERNPLKLAWLRWRLQLSLWKEFLLRLERNDLIGSILRADTSHQQLVRDQFNTRKLVVVVTRSGKLYGLDTSDGRVLWQLFSSRVRPFSRDTPLQLYILRSTSHPLHPPLGVVIGKSRHPSCNHTLLLAFNPLTGDFHGSSEDAASTCLPQLLQASLLNKQDHTHSKMLLLLTKDLEVLSYPASAEVQSHLVELQERLFFFVVDKERGTMDGYHVSNDEERPSPSSFQTSHLWHVKFPRGTEKVLQVIPKPSQEQVSTVGRSRADRSVQYLYLNPNLVAIVTESTDLLRPAISVYLVDSVTGGVVFHTSHKAAASPLHLVHSENWIAYHYFSLKHRRHELAVVELYEAVSNRTRDAWSSLTPPPQPEVMTQAYAFPTSLVTMTTTQTKRGITSKSLLVGLKSGHVVAIPKMILDPRREVDMTAEMSNAGLPVYKPELGLSPLMYVNYNQTVAGLSRIYTTPSGLESTSLVLSCGLDLYFTRVLPSKQFDLLAVDFDYTLISIVVAAMVVGTYVLSKFAARKSLKMAWK